MTARIAASFISSGKGHSRPCAFARVVTALTVAVEHLHENAVFLTLTPIALCRSISLYLTIFSSFLAMVAMGTFVPIGIVAEKEAPLSGRVAI